MLVLNLKFSTRSFNNKNFKLLLFKYEISSLSIRGTTEEIIILLCLVGYNVGLDCDHVYMCGADLRLITLIANYRLCLVIMHQR